jgi:hypothetical protein
VGSRNWQKQLVDAINKKFPNAARESKERHNYILIESDNAFDYQMLWVDPKLKYLIDGYEWSWSHAATTKIAVFRPK